MEKNHKYEKEYKIAVSGSAETEPCNKSAKEMAEGFGEQVAKAGHVLITGATSGIPFWSAIGAKRENGTVIGISPASSLSSHVKTYKLPTDYHDILIFTGFGYAGRNLIMTRSADAVVICCGRMGTLNEFTIAFEDQKPIGVLLGTGGTADQIKYIIEMAKRGPGKIVYDTDPKELLKKLIELIEKERRYPKLKSPDGE